jgi:NAD(P)-dependent dehydrogenase (short-subunit alcohol dehydrogenase family)
LESYNNSTFSSVCSTNNNFTSSPPLIPASFSADEVTQVDNPMERQGQPFELAPTFVYLASDDSRFVMGQTLHVNGGEATSS